MIKKLVWLLFVVSFLFGNLYKPSILDLVVVVITILTLVFRFKWYRHFLIKPIGVFCAVALLSLIVSLSIFDYREVLIGSLYLVRFIMYSLIFIPISNLLTHSDIKHLLLTLGLGTVGLGLLQYLFFPDIRSLAVFGWDPHYYRLVGTLLDPGFTGIILVFTLVILLLQPFKDRGIQAVAWVSTYLSLALTYSRASYLAFLVAMGFLAIKDKGWKFFVGMILLLGLTVVVLPRTSDGEGVKLERTNSIQARIDNWKNSLAIIRDYPLIGVGFNNYRYIQRDYGFLGTDWEKTHAGGADSSLLLVAATAGVIGLVSYLWYLKKISSLFSVSYYLVPLLAHAFFLNSLFYPAVMFWISLIVATAVKSPSTPA